MSNFNLLFLYFLVGIIVAVGSCLSKKPAESAKKEKNRDCHQLESDFKKCQRKLQCCQDQCEHGVWNETTNVCDCDFNFFGVLCDSLPIDCTEAHLAGYTGQGMLTIKPDCTSDAFSVWCEFGYGGWTFLEKRGSYYRQSGAFSYLSFDRSWDGYKVMFGTPEAEYFIGLDNIRQLLQDGELDYKLSVGIDVDQAYYHDFWIDSEANKYTMHYEAHSAWQTHPLADGFGASGSRFCAKDNDCGTCASDSASGWWFGGNCSTTNLHLPENPLNSRMGSWSHIDIQSDTGSYMMVRRLIHIL